MKVLQIAPLWERVPPRGYGGIEAVVSVLTDALVRAGHKVTLRASADSRTLAELRSVSPHSLRQARPSANGAAYEWVHAAEAIADAGGFDIIHNHAGEPVMALAGLVDTPMLTTLHNPVTPDKMIVWQRYAGSYNTISHAQAGTVPPLDKPRYVGAVHNAIDVDSFPFREEKEDYLLCLNRVHPEKGTHLAIDVARRTDRRLIIAGKVDSDGEEYFRTMVEPMVDGKQIKFVGEADYRRKRELYSRAACVLMPIRWEEPFGLVIVEAMACGTPVIAFARGAAPELIVDGETGFLVADVDSMVDALAKTNTIDPWRCRQHVEANFDIPVMTEGYLRLYREVADIRSGPERVPSTSQVPPFYARDRRLEGLRPHGGGDRK